MADMKYGRLARGKVDRISWIAPGAVVLSQIFFLVLASNSGWVIEGYRHGIALPAVSDARHLRRMFANGFASRSRPFRPGVNPACLFICRVNNPISRQ